MDDEVALLVSAITQGAVQAAGAAASDAVTSAYTKLKNLVLREGRKHGREVALPEPGVPAQRTEEELRDVLIEADVVANPDVRDAAQHLLQLLAEATAVARSETTIEQHGSGSTATSLTFNEKVETHAPAVFGTSITSSPSDFTKS